MYYLKYFFNKERNTIVEYEQEILFTLLDGVFSWCLP